MLFLQLSQEHSHSGTELEKEVSPPKAQWTQTFPEGQDPCSTDGQCDLVVPSN